MRSISRVALFASLVAIAACSPAPSGSGDGGVGGGSSVAADAGGGGGTDASIDDSDAGTDGGEMPDAGSGDAGTPDASTPVDAGCSTHADVTADFTYGGQKFIFNLGVGQSAAVSFHPTPGATMQLNTTETTSTPPETDHEVAVSQCPGDFTPLPPCEYQAYYVGSTMNLIGATTGPSYDCAVDPAKTWYMNVRQVVKGNTSQPSCPQSACEIRVQVQGL